MSKTQKNVGKKTFKKVAKKKVSKPSKKTGLKKKVVSMKLKRKVKKVHRKKMKRGGAKYLSGQTDLGKIWNSILLRKGKAAGLIEKTPVKGKKYVLFVIDMQNDFSDAIYKREGTVQRFMDKNSYERELGESSDYLTPYTVDPKTEKNACLDIQIGNFGVAGVNDCLSDNLVNKIHRALIDPNCTEIIFTRDYHPDGHMSFSRTSSLNVPQYCTCQGGNFPVHCLQGHSGSRLIPAIESLLLDKEIGGKEKVRILFKGFDLNCDSFTAVPKGKDDIDIDNFASNQKQNNPCSTVSGAYDLANLKQGAAEYIKAAIEYSEHKISTKDLSPYVNNDKNKFDDVEEFQVCGLAGDYCVRDTVVSLAKMFPGKQVTLLGGLTRYAVLPLFTMQSVPIHNYSGNMNVPNIDATDYVPFNEDSPNIDATDSNNLVINPEVVENFNAINPKKSLYYYTLTMDKGTYQLVQTTAEGNELTEKVSTTNFVIPNNQFFHFITPPEVIIQDYIENSKDNNIKIRLYAGDVGH